ncbi:hypothetical protein V8J88_03395 [Massilia sp. W12]|uniref:hypothetical protein n=1 Tax=Massilia sp. W12 TaxID=3126507 RepID=UPI0030CAB7C2
MRKRRWCALVCGLCLLFARGLAQAQALSAEFRLELEILVHFFQPGPASFEAQKKQYLAALEKNQLPSRSLACVNNRMTRAWQRETMLREFTPHAGNLDQARRLNLMLALPAMRKAYANLSPAQQAQDNPLQPISGGKSSFTEEELAQLVLFSDTPEWQIFLRLGSMVKGGEFLLDASLALLNQCMSSEQK